MSAYNRVIWSDGLFLQPQHFQQQDRAFERYVESRCHALTAFSWGLTELEFESDLLRIGKIGLRRLAGVFPDGTPFRMPEDEPLPPAIDIAGNVRTERVFLAVPLRRPGEVDSGRGGADGLLRYEIREEQARGAVPGGAEPATLEVGTLRTRLMLESESTEAYACIPVANIIECRPDRQVVLDDQFMPTVLRTGASPRLATLMTEMLGMFRQRGDALGGRASASSRSSASELGDFLMLQIVNRYEPLFAHLVDTQVLHPEELYRIWVSAAGELATLTTPARRAPKFPGYRHERLQESFEPVVVSLRGSMSASMPQSAVPIPLEPRRFGISVAIVADRSLFSSAVFVLAARADGPAENLRQRFPQQVRVGPTEKISDLVRQGLPGVPVVPIPVAPRQIPFHAGYAYFELDRSNPMWEQLKGAGGVAVHVSGEFPGLAMELWAIRD